MLILWGVKKGKEDWQEEILSTQCKTTEDLTQIKDRASRDGFGRFRVSEMEDIPTVPDFSKVVNK